MIMHPIVAALSFTPSGQQGGGMSVFIIQIALFIAIFYFLLIRPQRQQARRHQDLLASLQKGDHIVTSGGVVGEVIHIKENQVTIRSDESRLVIVRSAITSITNRTPGDAKEAPPAKAAKDKEAKSA
jgi:preprotein translocase subunit YajC